MLDSKKRNWKIEVRIEAISIPSDKTLSEGLKSMCLIAIDHSDKAQIKLVEPAYSEYKNIF